MPFHTKADGGEIYYRQSGEGPPALFIHGVTLDSTLWLDQLAGLRDLRRCIAPDLMGHGRSDPNPHKAQPTSGHAADILELMDAVAPTGPVDLVGMSAGGLIAALLIEKRPQRIRSLTLISTVFPKKTSPAGPHNDLAQLTSEEGKGAYFRRQAGYLMAPEASLFVRARYRSMVQGVTLEALISFMTTTPFEGWPHLASNLTLPVLMPLGEFDPLSKAPEPDLVGRPNVTMHPVKGAARLTPIEKPDEINAMIRTFWRQV